MRPFRFGLLLERFPDPKFVLEMARRAEDEGFSTFLIRDHMIDAPFGPQYAPWTTLGISYIVVRHSHFAHATQVVQRLAEAR